jgi:hypothetical protein
MLTDGEVHERELAASARTDIVDFANRARGILVGCGRGPQVCAFALQIQRETGLTSKSALFLMHRIARTMPPANEQEPKLGVKGGIVEYDETYVGGKPRGQARYSQEIKADGTRKLLPGVDFADRKTPVVGGIERDGRVKVRVVPNITTATLAHHVANMVDKSAHLQTDQAQTYKAIGQQ